MNVKVDQTSARVRSLEDALLRLVNQFEEDRELQNGRFMSQQEDIMDVIREHSKLKQKITSVDTLAVKTSKSLNVRCNALERALGAVIETMMRWLNRRKT